MSSESAAARAEAGAGSERWVLAATILGSSMVFIDGSVVNVALPLMQRALGASVVEVQWIVESYALLLAALILVGGSLGDHYGRRRIFSLGVLLFMLSSVACGLAQSALQLIVARGVQGVGGALLVPGSLAIISATFPGERRGRAIGTWSGFTAITTALGPVLGGWLAENVSWRAIFFLNVPLALAVIAITRLHVPESRDAHAPRRLDYAGAALVTLGLGAVVYALTEASAAGLGNARVLLTLAAGVVLLGVFVAVEARSAGPMVPLGLFRSRTFSGANLLTLLLYAALGGSLLFLPFNLIGVQGYSATVAGFALLPFVLINFALSRWAGGLVARYGARRPLIVGPLIAAAGFALFAVPGIGGGYWLTVFPAVAVLGLGMAITIAPLTTAVMGAASADNAGIASGINNAVSRVAGLLAVALLSLALVGPFNQTLESRLDALNLPAAARQEVEAQRSKLLGIPTPAGLSNEQQAALKGAIGESFVAGYRLVMLLAAGLAAASALSAALMIREER